MKLGAVCGAETTPVLCCHLAIFFCVCVCVFWLLRFFPKHASLVRAAHARVRVKTCSFSGGVRWISGAVLGRSGMDSPWCPIVFAALAVSLCSSPALADRKFGKQLFHYYKKKKIKTKNNVLFDLSP